MNLATDMSVAGISGVRKAPNAEAPRDEGLGLGFRV